MTEQVADSSQGWVPQLRAYSGLGLLVAAALAPGYIRGFVSLLNSI